MKKLLVALLALSITGFAFAADAPAVASSFSAYLDTGFQYNATTDNLYTNGNDSGIANGRFNFNGSFSYGDFGLKFRFRNQSVMDMSSGSNTMSLRRAYAYYKLLNKMIEVDVGGLGVATYYTPWNGVGTGDDPNNGAMVQVMPMAGLSVAYFLPVVDLSTATPIAKTSLSTSVKTSDIMAAYSVDKLADFLFVAKRLGNSGLVTPSSGATAATTGLEVIASANVTAVDGLTGIVEVDVKDLGASSQSSGLTFVGGYNVTKEFNATVVVGATLASATTWFVNPELAYTLSDVHSVGGDFTYNSDGTYSADAWYKASLGKNFIKGIAAYDGTDFKVTGSFVSSF